MQRFIDADNLAAIVEMLVEEDPQNLGLQAIAALARKTDDLIRCRDCANCSHSGTLGYACLDPVVPSRLNFVRPDMYCSNAIRRTTREKKEN